MHAICLSPPPESQLVKELERHFIGALVRVSPLNVCVFYTLGTCLCVCAALFFSHTQDRKWGEIERERERQREREIRGEEMRWIVNRVRNSDNRRVCVTDLNPKWPPDSVRREKFLFLIIIILRFMFFRFFSRNARQDCGLWYTFSFSFVISMEMFRKYCHAISKITLADISQLSSERICRITFCQLDFFLGFLFSLFIY